MREFAELTEKIVYMPRVQKKVGHGLTQQGFAVFLLFS